MNKEKELNQLKEELASFKIGNDSTIPETEDDGSNDGSDVETSFITNLPSCSNDRNTKHPFNRQISIQTTSSDSQDSKWDSESDKNCQKPQMQKKKLMWWKVGKKKSIK
ncbi:MULTISPECIES: hypothetical protein [unclassified Spiroplasma]|uniref:hypothetical protein n=1 Tax=unclassified Spiroplasma TaxID=2637901 RepID=UPI00313C8CFD